MNSLWLVITALAAFAVAYRFYGAFLAAKVAVLNDTRPTPAHRLKDGVDYHPTNKLVLFGHHFAAIAGPGPLIGPVLAAQWGFLPGYSWIVIGACLGGAVSDFVVLWASVRQDGLTLSKIAHTNIGPLSGLTTSIATLFIIVAVLASVAIVVVNALADSAWGMFTILLTIPAAVLTGLWMYKIRPGKVAEASVIGVSIVMAGVLLGKPFASSPYAHSLIFSKPMLSLMLPVYALITSVLPVWVLMCPRDYLSSYMKIGVMVVLAVGIFIAHPVLKMPATTPFLAGGGPVVSGAVWPFVFITIMCGALSGFHALIASGTTPKMINKESDIKPIGYGAMVVEGFVAVTALVAACSLAPGDYFAINADAKNPALHERYTQMLATPPEKLGFDPRPVELGTLEQQTQEKLAGRTGGAVTLAVGMARVFASVPGFSTLMAYWYHFVIMFEALFILTLLETGTRVARFVFAETVAGFRAQPPPGATEAQAAPAHPAKPNWLMNVGTSVVVCLAWGYLLYMGNLNTLWRMLGIANQVLAAIALAVGTTYMLNHAPKRRYAFCTGIPFVIVLVTVTLAGIQSIAGWRLEAIDTAAKAMAAESAETAAKLSSTAFQLKLMCALAGIMLGLTGIIAIDAARRWWQILARPAIAAVAATGG